MKSIEELRLEVLKEDHTPNISDTWVFDRFKKTLIWLYVFAAFMLYTSVIVG